MTNQHRTKNTANTEPLYVVADGKLALLTRDSYRIMVAQNPHLTANSETEPLVHMALRLLTADCPPRHLSISKTDLVEMTHHLYEAEVLLTHQGMPVTFRTLLNCIFTHLDIKGPSNAYQLLHNAMQRKGRRVLSLAQRCAMGAFSTT